jgi:hypothetical protein
LTLASKTKFAVGDRVIDTETRVLGTVVYCYEDPRLAGEIVAVKFDVGDVPVAVPTDTIRRARAPIAKRHRGGAS